MLHLLHGNMGLPDHFSAPLESLGCPVKPWHLWNLIRTHKAAATSLDAAALHISEAAARSPGPRWLAGYSMGGRLALHAVLTDPALWQGAVILSAHPGLPEESARAARREADAAWAARCLTDRWSDVVRLWQEQPLFAGSETTSDGLEPWRHEIAAAFTGWSLGAQADLRPALATLPIPVLWITGAADVRFSELGAEISAANPWIRHVVIDGAGHRLCQDAAEATATLIDGFIKAHLSVATQSAPPN